MVVTWTALSLFILRHSEQCPADHHECTHIHLKVDGEYEDWLKLLRLIYHGGLFIDKEAFKADILTYLRTNLLIAPDLCCLLCF